MDSGPRPDAPPIVRTRVSLRQLEAFCAVVLAGGVSRAAVRLARTQSAVSASIAELEAAIGTALFERAGRGLRPTEAARRLLPHALDVVERAAELPALASGAPDDGQRLQVGASRTIGPFVMPALIARFAARRPGTTVELSVANTADLLARLRRLELDLAFVEGHVVDPEVSIIEWMRDELCLFARAGHPVLRTLKGGRPSAGFRDALAASRWALREPGSGTQDTFLRALAPVIGQPRPGVVADDPLALQRLVAEGDWLGCLSRRAIADALRAGALVALPAPDRDVARALVRRFWVVRLPGRYRGAALDALLTEAGVPPERALSPGASARRSAPSRRSRR